MINNNMYLLTLIQCYISHAVPISKERSDSLTQLKFRSFSECNSYRTVYIQLCSKHPLESDVRKGVSSCVMKNQYNIKHVPMPYTNVVHSYPKYVIFIDVFASTYSKSSYNILALFFFFYYY